MADASIESDDDENAYEYSYNLSSCMKSSPLFSLRQTLDPDGDDDIDAQEAVDLVCQNEDKHIEMTEVYSNRRRLESQSSIVDGLLSEIYDRWHDHRHDSFDSDTFTECSSTSEFIHWRRNSAYHDLEIGGRQLGYLHRGVLQEYGESELRNIVSELSRRVNQMSTRLVRQLKRRERRMSKLQTNCDILTAIIQASSPKRRIDTRMRFTVEPSQGDDAFEQWKDAMKAVARLPLGIPEEFRKKVWLSLADQHIKDLKIDWEKTVRFAFNERSNPDDNKLGLQIVKDLHRTGCTGFSGEENEEERALLKRILLAYARWNKAVGYCQGFNVIAALLLDVMDRKEADALKVMIYLIDHVLPQSYFANNLRALSVDMAVFRDLLKIFPKLSKHLDYLQHAQDQVSGGCYEPPLTNVFTMQWFLTLFATCLPKSTVLRVWDSILLDGSEILLRTALTIWGKLSSRILTVSSADEFYTLMGDITHEMLEGNILDADSMIKSIYSIAPFPFPQLGELREKYTYNIRPFTPANKKAAWGEGNVLPSDEDDLEDEEIEAITCFTGFIPTTVTTGSLKAKGLDGDQKLGSVPDISSLGPGAYGLSPTDSSGAPNVPAYMERMTTDISALKKQYAKLRQRQNQAHIILTTASARKQAVKTRPMMPTIETPTAVNHLFLTKQGLKGRNRYVAAGPRIANMYPIITPLGTGTPQQPVQPQTKVENSSKWGQKSRRSGQPHTSQKQVSSSAPSSTDTSPQREISKEQAPATATSPKHHSNAGIPSTIIVDGIHTSPTRKESQNTNTDRRSTEDVTKGEDVTKEEDDSDCNNSSLKVEGDTDCNDSGLGNSLSSPVHSLSSSECSPLHAGTCTQSQIVAEAHIEKSYSEDKLDHFYEETADVWSEHSDVSKVSADLLEDSTAAISDTNSSGEPAIDPLSEIGEHTHLNTEDMSNTGDDETLKDKTNTSLEQNSAERTFASVEATERETGTAEDQQLDSKPAKSYSASDADNVGKSQACRQVNRHSVASGQHIDTKTRSDSDASVISGSGSDSENFPDVFSSDSANFSHSKSFQQYYATKRNLSVDSGSLLTNPFPKTNVSKKSFNPFPVKHLNQNRAKTGIKLGLYKPSTLEEYERNLKNQPSVWTK